MPVEITRTACARRDEKKVKSIYRRSTEVIYLPLEVITFNKVLTVFSRCFVAQSVVMLMFREEKSPEDEIKAWQFWHGRQHSVKQRILDAGK